MNEIIGYLSVLSSSFPHSSGIRAIDLRVHQGRWNRCLLRAWNGPATISPVSPNQLLTTTLDAILPSQTNRDLSTLLPLPPYKPSFSVSDRHFLPEHIHLLNSLNQAMFEGKAIIDDTDMLQTMQKDAVSLAARALDVFDVTDSIDIACLIKKEFDRLYGPGWQCIVGTDFGSFVTHCHGCFIHFCIGSLAILLFRGTADSQAGAEANRIVF